MTQYSYTRMMIADGPRGIAQTLDIMCRLAREGKTSPDVRLTAIEATRNFLQKDYRREAEALTNYVRDEIRYVRDILHIETLQTPQKTLEVRAGDCDDKCILLASLLMTIGHPARFVAVDLDGSGFRHVSVQTRLGPRWVWAETTEPWTFGRGPARLSRVLVRNC